MSFELREAAVRDVAELATLHVATFRETHGGGPPVSVREHQWQHILGANDANDFTFVVEDDEHHLVAFARALVRRVADRFLTQGVTSMLLFGDARNPSNGFYEHLGAVRLLSPEGEFNSAYGWPDLTGLIESLGGRRI